MAKIRHFLIRIPTTTMMTIWTAKRQTPKMIRINCGVFVSNLTITDLWFVAILVWIGTTENVLE